MRVMFDTNILVSAGLFGSSRLAFLAEQISDEHSLVLSKQIIDEFHMVMTMKFPDKRASGERFLSRLSFELAFTPEPIDPNELPRMRDHKDYPILASAINADVDAFITGDKDFSVLNIERPEILSIEQFADKYL